MCLDCVARVMISAKGNRNSFLEGQGSVRALFRTRAEGSESVWGRNGGLDWMLPSHWASDVTANVGLTASIPPSVSPLSLPPVWECERGAWSLYLSWTADSLTHSSKSQAERPTTSAFVCLMLTTLSLHQCPYNFSYIFFNLNCFSGRLPREFFCCLLESGRTYLCHLQLGLKLLRCSLSLKAASSIWP